MLTLSLCAGMTACPCFTMCCREVVKHGPQPEWNDFEPSLPQRLAKASAHLVQPASQEAPQVRICVSRSEALANASC